MVKRRVVHTHLAATKHKKLARAQVALARQRTSTEVNHRGNSHEQNQQHSKNNAKDNTEHGDIFKATIIEPNIIERYRVPRDKILLVNLSSVTLWLSTMTCVSLCHHFVFTYNAFIYTILVVSILLPIQYHLAKYESFRNINKVLSCLRHSRRRRNEFVRTITGIYQASDGRHHQAASEISNQHGQVDKKKLIKLTSPEGKIIFRKSQRLYHLHYDQISVSHVWLNKIIQCCWPYLAQYIQQEMSNLSKDNPHGIKLDNGNRRIKFEHIQLGQTPPVITEIRLNREGIRKDELVFDVKLLYNGDFIMSIIYKYLYFFSSRAGIKDIFLRFNMRIQLRPIKDTAPFIGGLCFTLLELPTIDYTGLNLGEMAELKFVRIILMNLITAYMIQPEFIAIPLVKPPNLLVQELMLEAKLECVKNMKKQIKLFASSAKNRRVNMRLRQPHKQHPSSIRAKGSLCSSTNKALSLMAPSDLAEGVLFKGEGFSTKQIIRNKAENTNKLPSGSSPKVLTDQQQEELINMRPDSLIAQGMLLNNDWEREVRCPIPAGICLVQIVEAANLPMVTSNMIRMFQSNKPNPYCSVLIGKHLFKTPMALGTVDPFWGYSFAAPVHDLYDRIKVCTLDRRKFFPDRLLGSLEFSLSSVIVSSSYTTSNSSRTKLKDKMRNGSDCWLRLNMTNEIVAVPNTIYKRDKMVDLTASYIHIRLAFAPLDSKWKLYDLNRMEPFEVYPPFKMSYSPRLSIHDTGTDGVASENRKLNLFGSSCGNTRRVVPKPKTTITPSRRQPFPSAVVTLYLNCVDRFNSEVADYKHFQKYAPHLEVTLNSQKYADITCNKYDKDFHVWPIKRQLNLLCDNIYTDIVHIKFKGRVYYAPESIVKYEQMLQEHELRMANIAPVLDLVNNATTTTTLSGPTNSDLHGLSQASTSPSDQSITANTLSQAETPVANSVTNEMPISPINSSSSSKYTTSISPLASSTLSQSKSPATIATTTTCTEATCSDGEEHARQIKQSSQRQSTKYRKQHHCQKKKRFLTMMAKKYLDNRGISTEASLYLSPNKIRGDLEGELKLELGSLFDYSLPQMMVQRSFDLTITSRHKILLNSSIDKETSSLPSSDYQSPRLHLFASLRFVRPDRKTLQNLAKPLIVLNLKNDALLNVNKKNPHQQPRSIQTHEYSKIKSKHHQVALQCEKNEKQTITNHFPVINVKIGSVGRNSSKQTTRLELPGNKLPSSTKMEALSDHCKEHNKRRVVEKWAPKMTLS